jgi:hypothetical protein
MHRFCHNEAPRRCLKRIFASISGQPAPASDKHLLGQFVSSNDQPSRRRVSCKPPLQDTLQGCRSIFGPYETHVSWKTQWSATWGILHRIADIGIIASTRRGYSSSLRSAPHFTHNIDIRKKAHERHFQVDLGLCDTAKQNIAISLCTSPRC